MKDTFIFKSLFASLSQFEVCSISSTGCLEHCKRAFTRKHSKVIFCKKHRRRITEAKSHLKRELALRKSE